MLVAAEDAGRYRDALGAMPPGGLPAVFLEKADEPLPSLLLRFARSRGPFTTHEAAERFGLEREVAEQELAALERADKLVRGELRPGGTEREWCDPDVLRRLRRASLAALRREVEPTEQAALGRFLPSWQGVDRRATLREALVPLQALALPVSLWESELLPRRVPGYQPAQLDQLCASGEVVWVGAGLDRVAIYFRDDAPVLGRVAAAERPEGEVHDRLREALVRERRVLVRPARRRPASRRRRPSRRCGSSSGRARSTNDAWTPLRAGRRYGIPRPERRPRRFSRQRASAITATQGRWSLTDRLFRGDPDRRALAELLLERQGIVTRDGVRAEGIPGGYGAVYGELRALETLGLCRRGYFVEGLGGAQFALGGRGRAAARAARAARTRSGRRSSWPRPIPRSLTARRCPGLGGPARAPRGSRARTSSCSGERQSSSSSAAAARSCRCVIRTRAGSARRSRPSSRMSAAPG